MGDRSEETGFGAGLDRAIEDGRIHCRFHAQLIFTSPPLTVSMPPPSTVWVAEALLVREMPPSLVIEVVALLVRSVPALLVSAVPAVASNVWPAFRIIPLPALIVIAPVTSIERSPLIVRV